MSHPEKYTSPPLMSAEALLEARFPAERRKPAPETVLIIMQPEIYRTAVLKIGGRKSDRVPAKVMLPGRWNRGAGPGILGEIGVGGAAVVAHLEFLAAWGVKRVILLGTAGGLTPNVSYGDLVIPSKALRDDGVSDHYLPAERWAWPSESLNQTLCGAVKNFRPKSHLAPVWTTSAPFRETEAEVRDYAAEGMMAVEMEAASLFAAAQKLGVEAAAVLVISDSLATGAHQVAPKQKMVTEHLKMVCDQLIRLFS